MCGPGDLRSWTRCSLTCRVRDRGRDFQERARADDRVSDLSLYALIVDADRLSFAAFGLGAPLGAGTGTLIGGAIASTGE